MGGAGDAARTLAVCELLAAAQEDMVVKALSWALRALAHCTTPTSGLNVSGPAVRIRDIAQGLARRLGVEPAGCVVFEDTDIGLEAARRAGMHDQAYVFPPQRLGDRALEEGRDHQVGTVQARRLDAHRVGDVELD